MNPIGSQSASSGEPATVAADGSAQATVGTPPPSAPPGPPTSPMSAAGSGGGGEEPMSFESAAVLLRHRVLDPPTHPGVLANVERFEVLRLIGAGGMGVVVLGRSPVDGRPVAIKLLKPELVGNARAVHQFLVEARHMSHLDHPHILKVTEVSDRPHGPYYVMPYLERGPLSRLIKPGVPLDGATARRLAEQVADAVAHAHAKGLIHRDLKPSNVLLDGDGNARVSDFGLVRTLNNDSVADVRQSQCEGTAPYMSPAVARGEAEDTRCDIYAIGATLYEMLTGRPPYTGRTSAEVIAKVLAGPPAPILKLNPKADAALAKIAEGAMARDLRDRYARAADVAEDLRRVGRRTPPRGPHGGAASGHATRRQALAWAAAGLLLVGLAVAAVLRSSPRGATTADASGRVPGSASPGSVAAAATRPAGRASFRGTPFTIPCTINAASFDEGGDGVGYHDAAPGPVGHPIPQPRAGVDARDAWDPLNADRRACFLRPGGWLAYTVEVAEAGGYNVSIFANCVGGSGPETFHVEFDGADAGPLVIRNTSWRSLWQVTSLRRTVRLTPGRHVVRVVFGSPGGSPTGAVGGIANIDVTNVVKIPPAPSTSSSTRPVRETDLAPNEVRRYAIQYGASNMALTPDGAGFLVALDVRWLQLRDAASGRVVWTYRPDEPIQCDPSFGLSADGRTVVVPCYDGTARVVDAHDGRELRRLVGHETTVRCAAVSADARVCLTAGGGSSAGFGLLPPDNSVRLWDLGTGTQLRKFDGHADGISSVAIAPDGRTGASGSRDRTVKLWDLTNGDLLATLPHGRTVAAVAFSPDGKSLLVAGSGGAMCLWDVRAAKVLRQYVGSTSDLLTSCAFSVDRRLAACGSWDKTATVWDVETAEQVARLVGHAHAVSAVTFTPDGKYVYSASYDGSVRLWRIPDRPPTTRPAPDPLAGRTFIGHAAPAYRVAFSRDGRAALSGGGTSSRGPSDPSVRLWDVATGEELKRLDGNAGTVSPVFLPDGKRCLTACADGTVRLWDLASGKPVATLASGAGAVWAAAVSPDGRSAVTGGADKVLHLWDVERRVETGQFVGSAGQVWYAAFSPDGTQLVSGGSDRMVRLWDVATRAQVRQMAGHEEMVSAAIFSPDGRQVLSSERGVGGRIILWDARTGEAIRRLSVPGGWIWGLAFLPDGQHALSAGSDRIVRAWDLRTGDEAHRVTFAAPVNALALSPDGTQFLTAHDTDWTVHLTPVPADLLPSTPDTRPATRPWSDPR